MIRSTEAVIAAILMLGTLIYLFRVPETESKDPAEQYIRSILSSYSEVARDLGARDPYTLKLLIEAAMPHGYGQKVNFNYYKTLIAVTGFGQAPIETYHLLPAEGKATLPDTEMKSNWYRSIFRISNTGSGSMTGEFHVSANLYKPDLNGDGTADPIDLDSLQVFSDDGQLNSSLENYEDYFNRTSVGLSLDVDLSPGEIENVYVYYLVGDDYE